MAQICRVEKVLKPYVEAIDRMTKNMGDLAASIRQKLLNFSKTHNEPFQQVLVNFALERLLYRLSISEYSDRFVLKGTLLFRL